MLNPDVMERLQLARGDSISTQFVVYLTLTPWIRNLRIASAESAATPSSSAWAR